MLHYFQKKHFNAKKNTKNKYYINWYVDQSLGEQFTSRKNRKELISKGSTKQRTPALQLLTH